MRDKITVIGSLNYDIILKIGKLPQKGETLTADAAAFSAGGKGANQAVQAAKLAVHTAMVGCVGRDAMGEQLIRTAEQYGVDVSHIRRCDANTGMGVVQALNDGSVYATIVRGANYEIRKADIDAALPLLRESSAAVFQMEIPADVNAYAMEAAKREGCQVLLNAAPASPVPDETLSLCDVVAVNEVEAAFYCGYKIETRAQAEAAALNFCSRYHNKWILTLGALGSVLSDGTRTEFIPSLKVHAIETTGAGDSYMGAFAYALKSGYDYFEAGRFATCCSALTVQKLGAQDSMPTLKEAMELYEKI